MKNKRILLAALSVCGVMLFATACQKPTEQSLTLYAGEEYQYKIVCSTQIDAEEASAITAFTDLLEKRCGKAPELVYDSGAEDTEGVPEILIGKLNRLESKLPDLKEQETYWCVTTKGEDIVINGSTSTALQVAMDYFMSLCDYDKESATFHVSGTLAQEHRQDGYYRDRWLLREIPSYWGNNELDGFVYDCGSIVTSKSAKEGACLMQTVRSTNATEAASYAKLLTENGFKQVSHNTMEKNEFYRFTNDKCKISLNYFDTKGMAEVILDESSIATTDISYSYEPKAGERAEVYLYGGLKHVNFDDPNRSMGVLGGTNMVIKCSDNSVILIDGGEEVAQFEEKEQAEFLEFLRRITGTAPGEKVRVSAWYITHGHGDHVNGVSAFLRKYTANVNLERVVLNLPSSSSVQVSETVVGNIKKAAMLYNCQEVKVHTGDVLTIADIKMEVLFTHEDLTTANGVWDSQESNDASVVAKLTTTDGMSLLMTGDMDVASCAVLEEHFTTETMKSTLGLIPHHLYNKIPESWYKAVSPQYFLVGQSEYNINQNTTTTAQAALAKKYSGGLYCSGGSNYGFAYQNGRAALIVEEKRN